ncbi:MAG: protein kinase [Thermodesulfobacteriota bacterium]|nr:protein kinase [Thermodesulfobacteriota bacterium]
MGNLRDYEIFKDYSDELLTELSNVIIEKEFEENEIIFREGDEGDSVYIVTEGEVAIKRSLDKPGDEEKTIAMIEKGNFFGEMALFDSKPRSGSAYASRKSRVLILKKEDFLGLTKKDPNTAMTTLMTINKVMSERLRKTSKSFLSGFEFGNILSAIRGFIKGAGGAEAKTDMKGDGFGRYQMIRELGRGSMGVVYQGRDPQIDRLVALKVLRQDRITSEAFVLRFLKEAKAIGRLSHPRIVSIYDVGQGRGTIYLAMEFIEGETLNHIIEKKKLSLEEIINLNIQIAETLDYAHQKGIVHRDIKPSNIILQVNGQIKITDFGIARIEDPSMPQQTQAGEILGTPAYMSPEQVLSHPVDGRSDLFSLGIILYESTTGSRPFRGENMAAIFNAITQEHPIEPSKINPAISQSLSQVIMKCLSKKPDDRFDRGKSLAEALKNALQETEPSIVTAPIAKKRLPYALLIPIAMTIVILGILFYYLLIPKEKAPPAVPKTEPAQKIEKVLSASLIVESTPTGAQVFVDGMLKGKTPIKLGLPVGKHDVRVTLSGYQDWKTQVQLKEESETPLHVQLKPILRKGTKDSKFLWY